MVGWFPVPDPSVHPCHGPEWMSRFTAFHHFSHARVNEKSLDNTLEQMSREKRKDGWMDGRMEGYNCKKNSGL